jgi:hypothetical protein
MYVLFDGTSYTYKLKSQYDLQHNIARLHGLTACMLLTGQLTQHGLR